MWMILAILSAVFAALTSILAKVGIDGVNSNLATALRTCVVLVMAWGMVFITDAQFGIGSITRKSWIFLILSGLATGASWLCYYKALQLGDASKVVPIDKLSIGYIQKLCVDWLNNGVDTTLAAEERIKALNQRRTVWYMISSTFGLIKRSPSKKEEELADLCAELGYGREILKEAYSRTIDSIGEYNVKYILTIIKITLSNTI